MVNRSFPRIMLIFQKRKLQITDAEISEAEITDAEIAAMNRCNKFLLLVIS